MKARHDDDTHKQHVCDNTSEFHFVHKGESNSQISKLK